MHVISEYKDVIAKNNCSDSDIIALVAGKNSKNSKLKKHLEMLKNTICFINEKRWKVFRMLKMFRSQHPNVHGFSSQKLCFFKAFCRISEIGSKIY